MAPPTPARHLISCMLDLLTILSGATVRSRIESIQISGASRLADNNIVINSATSVECLAGVDFLCTGVTGTVTEDRLSVQELYCINCKADDIILTACLTARLTERDVEVRDSIDMAPLWVLKRYTEAKAEINRCGILNRSPFHYDTKRSSASVGLSTGERILCYKGAPLYILQYVLQHNFTISDDVVDRYKNGIKEASKRCCRTLGVVRRYKNGKMELSGLIPFFQAPRYDSVASIRLAKSLGLSVKFLAGFTGADTAHTMKLVGLGGEVLSCGDGALRLTKDSFNAEVSKRVEAVSGFAEEA